LNRRAGRSGPGTEPYPIEARMQRLPAG
jgi:hypothetical protein